MHRNDYFYGWQGILKLFFRIFRQRSDRILESDVATDKKQSMLPVAHILINKSKRSLISIHVYIVNAQYVTLADVQGSR